MRLAEGIAGKKDAVAIEGQADISAAKLNFDGLSSKDAKGIIVKGKARADIPDPKVVGKLFQASLPDLPPVTIAANIAASGQLISVDDFNAVLGKSSFTGNFTADFEAKRPKINGTVSAKLIDMAELSGSEKKAVEKAKVSGAEGRLIPTQSLAIPPLDMADINLTISIEKLLTARNLIIQNLQTNVVLTGGRLALKPLKMHIAGTDINLEGNADGLGRANVKLSANLNACRHQSRRAAQIRIRKGGAERRSDGGRRKSASLGPVASKAGIDIERARAGFRGAGPSVQQKSGRFAR